MGTLETKVIAEGGRVYVLATVDGDVLGTVVPKYDAGTGRDSWTATIGGVRMGDEFTDSVVVERVTRRFGATRKAAVANALAAWEAGT